MHCLYIFRQDQVEYYWPAWRTAIQAGKIAAIMCSYNAVNGVPSCGNDYFMNQVAREEWGFGGFIESDCSAISDQAFTQYIERTYSKNNSAQQILLQAKTAITAGCDTNCGNYYLDNLQNSVEAGVTPMDALDTAVTRLFTKAIDLGKLDFNPPSYYTDSNAYGLAQIDSEEHRTLALSAAEQGIVLLKNDGVLPLTTKNVNGKKIALVGPHANATREMLSNYVGDNTLVYSNSPYDAFKAKSMGYDISYSAGCQDVYCNTTKGFSDAISTAKAADYVIVVLGLHPSTNGATGCRDYANAGSGCEAEGWDRNTVELPANQTYLLTNVTTVNKNVILVLINAGPIDVTYSKNSKDVRAIIEAFYPGQAGGPAIRNIIYGETAPSGKLPITNYDKSILNTRKTIMDMSLRDNGGITYRYYTGKPLYPFGYGLYYTTFNYTYYNSSQLDTNGERVIETKSLADFYRNGYYNYKSESTSFIVEVYNTGPVASDCVVLGFVTSESDPDAPLIKLFDFGRVYVPVGSKVNVTLSITPESISVTNKDGNERIVPGKYNIFMGDYMNNNYVHHILSMIGNEESIFDLKQIKEKYNAKRS